MGAGGDAGGDQPARLAGHRRALARAVGRRSRGCATSWWPRATPTRSCSAWAARASRPRSSARASGRRTAALSLHVLDSTHPDEVRKFLDGLDLDKSLMVVSSKSGGTIEPMSMYKAFSRARGRHALRRRDRPGDVAGEASPARRASGASFHGDPDIGGRYSALSAFGLVPAAVAGFDVAGMLDSAIGAAEECRGEQGNAGLWLGCALGELALQGRDKLTIVADAPLQLLRRVGRAARRRVDRQAGPRHPADRRRAARSTATATTASSCTSRSTTPSNAREARRAATTPATR